MTADGKALGKTDSNIENGISVEEACEDLLKAIYLKKFWITLGSLYYQIAPRIMQISESGTYFFSMKNFKQ